MSDSERTKGTGPSMRGTRMVQIGKLSLEVGINHDRLIKDVEVLLISCSLALFPHKRFLFRHQYFHEAHEFLGT